MPFQVSYNNPVKVMPFWNFSISCLISSSCSWGHSSYPGAKYASYICPAYNLIELGSVPHHGTLTQYRVINEKGWQRSAQLLDGWFISVCEGGRQATRRRKKKQKEWWKKRLLCSSYINQLPSTMSPLPDQKWNWTLHGAEILYL